MVAKNKTSAKHKRWALLGWLILEAKYYYYISDKAESPITDATYDKIEKEYDTLSKELKEEPSAANMVGFDSNRPACQLVQRMIEQGMSLLVKHYAPNEVIDIPMKDLEVPQHAKKIE